jgi:hypothetical protein
MKLTLEDVKTGKHILNINDPFIGIKLFQSIKNPKQYKAFLKYYLAHTDCMDDTNIAREYLRVK